MVLKDIVDVHQIFVVLIVKQQYEQMVVNQILGKIKETNKILIKKIFFSSKNGGTCVVLENNHGRKKTNKN